MQPYVPAVMASLVLAATAAGQSTAFTYQGRLRNGAAAAAGMHDFRFRLFDAAAGGAQVGLTQCADNLLVAEGLFTATLDFGQQFATPAQRFLEIEVRADTGLNCVNVAGFVILGPRQAISPTPLANHARSAFSLDAPDGSPANAVFVDNDGRVGIGTSTPSTLLHARGAGPVLILQDTASAPNQVGYLGFWNSAGAETGWIGFGSPGSPAFGIVNARAAGHINLLPGSGGNVGIGTTTPSAPVHIARDTDPVIVVQDSGPTSTQVGYLGFWNSAGAETGWAGFGTPGSPQFSIFNARLNGNIALLPGPGGAVTIGSLFAAAAEENLRVIRGTVGSDGSILRGQGFAATRVAQGDYRIDFNTPFSGAPSVTATVDDVVAMPFGVDFHVAGVYLSTSSSMRIRTRQHSNASGVSTGQTDQPFHFIALGPR